MKSMEKELLETFEVAKKAADAAADGGGSGEEDRCVDVLKRLRKMPVTMNDLVTTQVGRSLRSLTKHPHEKIQAVASDLMKFWKDVVIKETAKADKKNNTPQNSSKVDIKSERAETPKGEKFSKSVAVKSEGPNGVDNKSERAETVKVEKFSKAGVAKSDGLNGVEKSMKKSTSATICPPKLTSLIKCNDPARDKLREILAEAFSRVYKETIESERDEVKNIWDEVDASDPIRAAVTVESAMFEKLGPSTGAHKVKYRSIMFNLKDGKNPDFRRRVLLGHVKPESFLDMTPEEMASDDRRNEIHQIKQKALFECERGAAPKATTDQFKCGRCGQRKTTYYQLQTRSADEPMTTFVACVNCNNHWKFC